MIPTVGRAIERDPGTKTMLLVHSHHSGSGWSRTPIPDAGLAVGRGSAGEVELMPATGGERTCADAWVLPFIESGVPHAALVVAPGVRDLFVGGRRPLGVLVLQERAEVAIGRERLYYTAREPLVIARHEGDANCGVCGEPAKGCDAITCTSCAAVTHEGALVDGGERLCFTHRGSCPGCQLRREDFEWTPEADDA